jgi:hypothetical protein
MILLCPLFKTFLPMFFRSYPIGNIMILYRPLFKTSLPRFFRSCPASTLRRRTQRLRLRRKSKQEYREYYSPVNDKNKLIYIIVCHTSLLCCAIGAHNPHKPSKQEMSDIMRIQLSYVC